MEVLLRLACALLLSGCVSTGPLSDVEVRSLSTREWPGAIDEVYDATWLTLQARGFEVLEGDRLAGTLKARRENREWNVDVAAVGSSQRVTLSVETPVARAELSQVLDVLEEGTAALLRAWADLPEWRFDGRRHLLTIPGFAVSPPVEWQWLDFDLSRRVVTVQRWRARNGANPTMLIEVDRTRPQSRLIETAKKAIAASVSARQRLSFPDDLKPGTTRVLDGTTPQEVTWRASESTEGSWQVRLVVACAGAECLPLPNPVRTERAVR